MSTEDEPTGSTLSISAGPGTAIQPEQSGRLPDQPTGRSTKPFPDRGLELRTHPRGRQFGYNLRCAGILQAGVQHPAPPISSQQQAQLHRSHSTSKSSSPLRQYRRSLSADSIQSSSSLSVLGTDDEETPAVDPTIVKGSIKLKGVVYPGMDIFDSASEAVRKTRNQKKDGTSLAEMRRQSALVLPNELIFHGDGGFKRQRPIQGYGSDDCPTTPECTPPPKRPARPPKRKVLGELDPNAGVGVNAQKLTKNGQPRKVRKPRIKKEDKPSTLIDLANLSADQVMALREVLSMSHPDVRTVLEPKIELVAPPKMRKAWQPTAEEKAEWKMTLNALHPVRNKAFQVFEDNDLPPIRASIAPRMVGHLDPPHCSQPLPTEPRHDAFSFPGSFDGYTQPVRPPGTHGPHLGSVFGPTTPHHSSSRSSHGLVDGMMDLQDYAGLYDPVAPFTMRRISSFDFDTSLSMSHPINFPNMNGDCHPERNSLRSSATRYHGGAFYDPFHNGIDLGYPQACDTDPSIAESPTERLTRKAGSELAMVHESGEVMDEDDLSMSAGISVDH